MRVNGKAIAQHILDRLAASIATRGTDRTLKVAFVQFGNDPASSSFVEKKRRVAAQLGIEADVIRRDAPNTAAALSIMTATISAGYDGIVLQLPVPAPLDAKALIDAIPEDLDIDALRPDTQKMAPVARAVAEIFSACNVTTHEKHVVVLGNGMLVGAPVARWLSANAETSGIADVAVFDKQANRESMSQALLHADIVISGTGQPHSITPNMLTSGVVLIDAGTSEQSGKIAGDCDPSCETVASLFSTTPGGVGPITIACLFANLIDNDTQSKN